MKKLVWLAGFLLALSLVFPNGVTLPLPKPPQPDVVVPSAAPDAEIVSLLQNATPEDKARIASVYTGLGVVLTRPKALELVTTTEKFAIMHGNTLDVAIDKVGEYPGLDEAIERVFAAAVGTDDVIPMTPELATKLVNACDVIVSSATAK